MDISMTPVAQQTSISRSAPGSLISSRFSTRSRPVGMARSRRKLALNHSGMWPDYGLNSALRCEQVTAANRLDAELHLCLVSRTGVGSAASGEFCSRGAEDTMKSGLGGIRTLCLGIKSPLPVPHRPRALSSTHQYWVNILSPECGRHLRQPNIPGRPARDGQLIGNSSGFSCAESSEGFRSGTPSCRA